MKTDENSIGIKNPWKGFLHPLVSKKKKIAFNHDDGNVDEMYKLLAGNVLPLILSCT